MRFHKNVLPIVREALRSPEIRMAIYGDVSGDSFERRHLNKGWNDNNESWDDPLILSKAVERKLIDLVEQADWALHMIEETIGDADPDDKQAIYTDKRRIKKFLKKWRNRKPVAELELLGEFFHKIGL